MNINALAEVLILTAKIFPAWSLNKFFNFFKPEYFIPRVHILIIKIKNVKMKTISIFSWTSLILHGMEQLFLFCLFRFFFTSYSPEGISFSPRIINIRALVKVLILATGIFLSLGLWNNYSLNAPNFRRW